MTSVTSESQFNTGQVVLNYAWSATPGDPLVLLHGGSARWQSFEALIPPLAEKWQVFAPDLRGHGLSGRTPGRYRLQDYTQDLTEFLQTVVGKPAHLFGHSLGGMIALMTAARSPGWVKSVSVGDSPLTSRTWQAVLAAGEERLKAWAAIAGGGYSVDQLVELLKNSPVEVPSQPAPLPMRQVFGKDAGVFPWLAHNLYHNDPEMLLALAGAEFENTAAGYEMATLLPALQCPVQLLQADPTAGGLLTDSEVSRALALSPLIRHARLVGLDHALHHIAPERVLQALLDFLRTLEQ